MSTQQMERDGAAPAVAGLTPDGHGDPVLRGPLGAEILAGGPATGGAAAILIHPLQPRTLGSPMHTHTREDEWSLILEGVVGFQLADRTLRAGPGDFVAKPRGVPHAFWNPGDVPARILEIITRSGFEEFFAELGAIFGQPDAPDLSALPDIARPYGLEIDPASVPGLVEAHDLRSAPL